MSLPFLDPNGSSIGNFFNPSGGSTGVYSAVSTTNSNDVLILDFTDDLFSTATPTSAHLTWIFHADCFPGGATLRRFYAIAASPLTSEVITVSGLTAAFSRGTVSAWSNVNTSTIFDSGGPQTPTGADPYSITTASANTAIIAYMGCNTPTSPGAGYTTIHTASGEFILSEYIIEASPGTYSVTIGTGGTGTSTGAVIDALIGASGGGGGFFSRYYYDLSGVRNV